MIDARFHGRRAALLLFMLPVALAVGAGQPAGQLTGGDIEQFAQSYYLQPRPDLVPQFMKALANAPFANEPNSWQPFAAWFAEVFAANPDRQKEWRKLVERQKKGWSQNTLSAGLTFHGRGGVLAMADQSTPGPPINDMYWGAFFGTGNPVYIRRLVDQLSRYDERRDQEAFFSAATAKWSLASNVRQHPRVREILQALRGEVDAATAATIDEVLGTDPIAVEMDIARISAEQKAAGVWF